MDRTEDGEKILEHERLVPTDSGLAFARVRVQKAEETVESELVGPAESSLE